MCNERSITHDFPPLRKIFSIPSRSSPVLGTTLIRLLIHCSYCVTARQCFRALTGANCICRENVLDNSCKGSESPAEREHWWTQIRFVMSWNAFHVLCIESKILNEGFTTEVSAAIETKGLACPCGVSPHKGEHCRLSCSLASRTF